MARFWVIAAVVAVAFMIYSLVDCALADRSRIRGPRKFVWILLILLLPIIGGLLWFVIGRGRATRPPVQRRPVAPDDDPAFLDRLRREADQEERIRRLEKELADLDDDPAADPDGPATPEGPSKTDGKDGTDNADRRDA
ncbi:PLDc N-terminal domain-containing protein [Herbiconiux sp. L3-i23]|uniref:PLDc N-terminal domain-containing protein n=1 Tax=Herbiconiux sp. L3-i23 TaxID=2905871 RepID=UPI002062638C|nr:PLDc N-terminal domain-containing protein [Herbiconiux sp. L3-i23]BDI21362.1 hypothetical protein L3i23_01380 [Herbiconiux sp. L3-i23]